MNMRVSDIGAQTSALQDWRRTTAKYAKLNEQITSGVTAKSYEEIPDHAGVMLHLNSKESIISSSLKETKGVDLKLSRIESTLDSLSGISGEAKRMFTRALGSGVRNPSFSRDCANLLNQVQGLLNTKGTEGDYLFGGTATNRPPVDISNLPNPGLGAGPNTTYYKGDSGIRTFRADEGTPEIDLSIMANEASLEKLIHALKIGATTNSDGIPDSESTQKLQQGLDLLNEANNLTGIPDLLKRVGDARAAVDLSEEILTEAKSIVAENIQEFLQTRLIEAMMLLGEVKVHLMASEKSISASLGREGILPFMK